MSFDAETRARPSKAVKKVRAVKNAAATAKRRVATPIKIQKDYLEEDSDDDSRASLDQISREIERLRERRMSYSSKQT